MWYWHGMGTWGWVTMLAFWVLLIILLVWLVRPTRSSEAPRKTALGLLEERFAKGEIDAQEYEERRLILER